MPKLNYNVRLKYVVRFTFSSDNIIEKSFEDDNTLTARTNAEKYFVEQYLINEALPLNERAAIVHFYAIGKPHIFDISDSNQLTPETKIIKAVTGIDILPEKWDERLKRMLREYNQPE